MPLEIERFIALSGYDGQTCWVHPRAGFLPPGPDRPQGLVVMVLQKLLVTQSDYFYPIHVMTSGDGGQSWSGPQRQGAFARQCEPGGIDLLVCDFVPGWHEATGTLLGTGHTVRYLGEHIQPAPRRRELAYAVFDPNRGAFDSWHTLPLDEERFYCAGSGSGQRCDLPDGRILQPVYFRSLAEAMAGGRYASTVFRCQFDGSTLRAQEQGNELRLPLGRGMVEPSLTSFGGQVLLTLRNDLAGYVSRSDDGLHFSEPILWRFDDGSDLGNYNTQQHWVSHDNGLWLVYTRKGLGNDHVFRHRAPLLMAQVAPQRLCVIRETEQILVPERGARLGNFGITRLGLNQSLVTVAEWMQPALCERHGSDNSIWAVRVTT